MKKLHAFYNFLSIKTLGKKSEIVLIKYQRVLFIELTTHVIKPNLHL